MQDKTINNALFALRREGGEVQELAERLLTLRGLHERPRIIRGFARRGQMQRLVLEAIKAGHNSRPDIAAYVADKRPEMPPERAYKRVDSALKKLQAKGLVRREGRVWLICKHKVNTPHRGVSLTQ